MEGYTTLLASVIIEASTIQTAPVALQNEEMHRVRLATIFHTLVRFLVHGLQSIIIIIIIAPLFALLTVDRVVIFSYDFDERN